MTPERSSVRKAGTAPELAPKLRHSFQLLLEARTYAEERQCEAWDFAVELTTLEKLGLTPNDFRWLEAKGFIQAATELTLAGEPHRLFRPLTHLVVAPSTCFVLTAEGVQFAQALSCDSRHKSIDGELTVELHESLPPRPIPTTPIWDRDRQELRLGEYIIKQYKVPAPNQEMVLAAFEEEHWPPRIDDPLPPQLEREPKRRLHETIHSLNRNQRCHLIRFMGDGSGEGVRWELTARLEERNGDG